VNRRRGLSVRVKLTISYAAILVLAGALVLAAAWLFVSYPTFGAILGLSPSRYELLRTFAPAAVVVMLFLVAFGLFGGWLLAGRIVAPLSRITAATRKAANGSLSHRIELDGPRDEFSELADAFDAMLARIEAHDAEQRRFAANASHELRTPLAVTQTLLDVARKDANHDNAELLERLRVVNSRAIELTEALLLLSRAEQRTFIREPVDLSLLAEEAAETLLPLAEKSGVTIETSGGIARTRGSHALLLQMTTNLVHNAIVHNLPARGHVEVRTASEPQSVTLTVENTGEKLNPQIVSILTEPFERATERARSDHGGLGLGLAIVKSIAQAHDGILTLSPRAGGGLRVSIQLPAAQPF
jgi:two-component system sensor histidine kinase VanS